VRARQATGALALAFALAAPSLVSGQAVKVGPAPGASPSPLLYEGLLPGVSSKEEIVARLGQPAHEGAWYAWKMLYPAKGRPGHFDAIHLAGRKVGTIEAASIPEGYEDRAAIEAKLGAPEFLLELGGGAMADYSALGLRFTFDAAGRTVGVAYFPQGYPRVHAGERHSLSLRALRAAPASGGVAAGGAPVGAAPDLLCGAAEADITPVEPDALGPIRYTVHDPLRARAVVLRSGGLTVAIVGGDIFGMQKLDVDPIEASLRESGIQHLVLAMSHVHTAGDPIGIYGFYPEKYVKRIQEGVKKAALDALAALRPVREVRVGARELPLDGARVEGFFRNARNPGIVDPQIAAIEVVGEDGKAIVTIAHATCHPEGIENDPKERTYEVSADFPGYLCEELRRSRGVQAVFLNGAVGGMVSGDTRERSHAEAEAHGKRIAKEIDGVLASASARRPTLTLDRRRVEIPVTNPRFVAFELTGRKRSYRGRLPTELFLIRLGGVELLSVPGELLPELSFEILERMRGSPSLIVGLTNDQIGYILPAYDFRMGEYEESMSLGPAAGPIIVEQAWRMLGSPGER